jgi:hypothetical protein
VSYSVTEALLEAHYTRALARLFAETFGTKVLRLLKPSTNKEVFVGFDQAWIKTELAEDQLEKELKAAITKGKDNDRIYVAFFLQFKLAELLIIRSKYCPTSFAPPYLRSELSLEPSEDTGISQHETLCRLQSALGSKVEVSYACGLLSSADDVYDEPDLDKLRIVPVKGAPALTPGRHFIAFQDASSQPFWCSEATEGSAKSLREWATEPPTRPRPMLRQELSRFLGRVRTVVSDVDHNKKAAMGRLPHSLTIVELKAPSG